MAIRTLFIEHKNKIGVFVKKKFSSLKTFFTYGTHNMFNAIEIETTTYCNLKCSYCPNIHYDRSTKSNERLMDIGLFKKIIDELSAIKYSGRISPHFYGEPLADKRMPEIVQYMREKLPKAKIIIYSNATYLGINLYSKLKSLGITGFVITQHTNNIPEYFEELLKWLQKDISKIEAKISKKPHKIIMKDGPVSIEYKRLVRIANRAGIINDSTFEKDKYPVCYYPNNPVVIDNEGNVILCCNDYHSSVKFGNLREMNLLDIWHSNEFSRIRRKLHQHKYNLPICQKCKELTNDS